MPRAARCRVPNLRSIRILSERVKTSGGYYAVFSDNHCAVVQGVLGSNMFSRSIAEITASTVVPVLITSVRSEF